MNINVTLRLWYCRRFKRITIKGCKLNISKKLPDRKNNYIDETTHVFIVIKLQQLEI